MNILVKNGIDALADCTDTILNAIEKTTEPKEVNGNDSGDIIMKELVSFEQNLIKRCQRVK